MSKKTISLSLLLAITLGMTACGGGDTTPKSTVLGDQNLTEDITAPVFDANINLTPSVVENERLVVATITVTDDSIVSFSLDGNDANSFEFAEHTDYSKVLKFKTAPDFESKSSYDVSVIVTDSEGNSDSKNITISIIDQPFEFDTTGSMGSVIVDMTKTIDLLTKEGKNTVTYTIEGSSNFSLNGNQVSFLAPEYNEAGSNSYSAVVTANDDDSEINLTVSAAVIVDGSMPVIKTYLLKSRATVAGGEMVEYSYDENGYLVTETLSGNNYPIDIVTTYKYFDNHSIMKSYDKYDRLKSIRVFEDKATDKNKFAAKMGNRFSVDEFKNFIIDAQDSAVFKHNRQITKYIYELDNWNTYAELYVYNDDDKPSRVLKGVYNITSDAIGALSDTKLHTLNAPNGGFPSASERLTNTQLTKLNSGDMPFSPNLETTYRYSNDNLVGLKFFGYGEGDTDSSDIDIFRFSDGTLKKFQSSDLNISYNTDKLLEEINNDKYSYTVDGTRVTVRVRNSALVSTYIFEEE